jgi:guanylate kinase
MSHADDPFSSDQFEPLLIVISGPSGVGKDTVIDSMKRLDQSIHFVVTATNRPPREGEIHGVDYLFVSTDEFAAMIENDELIEYAKVYNDYKGVPKEQVRQALASGKDVVMRVDVQGAATIKELCADALLIFLTTQDENELVERLKARQTETPEDLNLRIATARKELQRIKDFDYVVANRDSCLDEAVDTILDIIHAEHHRVNPRKVTL